MDVNVCKIISTSLIRNVSKIILYQLLTCLGTYFLSKKMKFAKTVHHEYKPTGCMKPCAGLHCHKFLKIQTQAGPYLLPAFWNNGYTQSGLNFQLGYYEVLKYGYGYKRYWPCLQ